MKDEVVKNTSAWRVLMEDDVQVRHKSNIHISNQSLANMLVTCTLISDTKIQNAEKYALNCSQLVEPVYSMQEGHRCFTYFSDIYGQTTRAVDKNPQLRLNFDRDPEIKLEIRGQFLFGISTNQVGSGNAKQTPTFTGMYLNVHDPTILPDMYGLPFHQLFPGYRINVPFAKRVQYLLPYPFDTACHKYTSKRRDYNTGVINSQFELRTIGECFLHCMWNLLNANKCANFYSIYTKEMVKKEILSGFTKDLRDLIKSSENLLNASLSIDPNDLFKLCPKDENSFSSYASVKDTCMLNCPLPCKVNTFDEVQAVSLKDSDEGVAIAHIWWAPQPVTEIRHTPKWNFTDFLGTIGGQVHIWLGISVIHLLWGAIKFVRSDRPRELLPRCKD